MRLFTVTDLQYERTAIRKSMALLGQRMNQMDAETRQRAERTILNLRGHVQDITDQLNMAGAK